MWVYIIYEMKWGEPDGKWTAVYIESYNLKLDKWFLF